jgi:hypothetical protein
MSIAKWHDKPFAPPDGTLKFSPQIFFTRIFTGFYQFSPPAPGSPQVFLKSDFLHWRQFDGRGCPLEGFARKEMPGALLVRF